MSFSEKSLEDLKNVKNKIEPIDKPSWTEYFITMAKLASTRSADAETKHGCVIADKKNRVIGVGYNSFPANMPDNILPNKRPEKYKWMVHAERNALANCVVRPEGCTAYITGRPCLDCAKSLYQEGIEHFVCFDGHGTYREEAEDKSIFEILVKSGDIKIEWVKPDFDKIINYLASTISQ